MLDTDVNLERLENDKRLCKKVTEILLVLTNAEKQGKKSLQSIQTNRRHLK
jgi:hypothetical protein